MKLKWILSTVLIGMPVLFAEQQCVVVRVLGSIEVPHKTLFAAQLLNIQLFDEIGVSMKWEQAGKWQEAGKWEQAGRRKPDSGCATVLLEFNSDSPHTLLPGALAYATPYGDKGPRIRIFADRVLRDRRTGAHAEAQLGYVLAHEIGHILEGVSRHSPEGVMKSHIPTAGALAGKLQFAREDVSLIHAGLRKLAAVAGAARSRHRSEVDDGRRGSLVDVEGFGQKGRFRN